MAKEDHLKESYLWAEEIIFPTNKSEGMTLKEIEKESESHYKQYLQTLKNKKDMPVKKKKATVKKKRKVNKFMVAMLKAKKSGAESFTYDGKKYNRKTKGKLVYYKKSFFS